MARGWLGVGRKRWQSGTVVPYESLIRLQFILISARDTTLHVWHLRQTIQVCYDIGEDRSFDTKIEILLGRKTALHSLFSNTSNWLLPESTMKCTENCMSVRWLKSACFVRGNLWCNRKYLCEIHVFFYSSKTSNIVTYSSLFWNVKEVDLSTLHREYLMLSLTLNRLTQTREIRAHGRWCADNDSSTLSDVILHASDHYSVTYYSRSIKVRTTIPASDLVTRGKPRDFINVGRCHVAWSSFISLASLSLFFSLSSSKWATRWLIASLLIGCN